MTPTKNLLITAAIVLGLASCSAEAEEEMTVTTYRSDSSTTTEIKYDSGAKAVDYIPPIGTGQSSAGNVKRERKFYIR